MDNDKRAMWFLAILLVLCAVFSRCGRASAQDVAELPEVPRVDLADVERLEPGARAPWAGVLLRPELLEALGDEIEDLRFRLTLEARRAGERASVAAELSAARVQACEDRLELRDDLWTARAGELSADLASARAREDRWTWEDFGLGFGIGGGVVAAIMAAILAAVIGG
jgi:hypothetical protein